MAPHHHQAAQSRRFRIDERQHDGAWMVSTRMPDPCADPQELARDGIPASLRWVIVHVAEDRGDAQAWARRAQMA